MKSVKINVSMTNTHQLYLDPSLRPLTNSLLRDIENIAKTLAKKLESKNKTIKINYSKDYSGGIKSFQIMLIDISGEFYERVVSNQDIVTGTFDFMISDSAYNGFMVADSVLCEEIQQSNTKFNFVGSENKCYIRDNFGNVDSVEMISRRGF